MFDTLFLTMRVFALLVNTGHSPEDAQLFAVTCVRNATELISAETLCAVAFVESKHRYRAHNAGGHCGAWQQHPAWSQMWGDDCWEGNRLLCRQPGGQGVTCEELMDVPTAGRVAARHLHYLTRRHGDRALCRYAGARGERCHRYEAAVHRATLALSR